MKAVIAGEEMSVIVTIQKIDIAVTQLLNGLANWSMPIDDVMIWSSALGVPLLVAAVAGQWWRRADSRITVMYWFPRASPFAPGLPSTS